MNVSTLDFTLGLRMLRRYPRITAIGGHGRCDRARDALLRGLAKALHPTLPVAHADRIVTIRYWNLGKRTVDERSLHDFAMSRTHVKTIEQFGAARDSSRACCRSGALTINPTDALKADA